MVNTPHGGTLCNLVSNDSATLSSLKNEAHSLETITLNLRQLCDTELILNGGFSPLRGFMNKDDYERVVTDMRLSNETLFPIPVTLDLPQNQVEKFSLQQRIALQDTEGNLIAVMTIESIYQPDKDNEAKCVFGSNDEAHPGVHYLKHQAHDWYVGGKLEGYQLPAHYDYVHIRKSPTELRQFFAEKGWDRIVGFQTRNPLHRSHFELTQRAAKSANCHLLLHPTVGMTKPGDVDHFTRVRCYQSLMPQYPQDMALLSLLPLAMRMGGPREALWHSIIRKNYGCTHFIVGRDHAGPGNNSQGNPFYGDYDAQDLVLKYASEVGIEIVPFRMVVFESTSGTYIPEDELKEGMVANNISGTELRKRLTFGQPIPEWFSFPSVVQILRESFPSRQKQGFTVFITGLSGAGKSSVANALMVRLMELTTRTVSVLDGDVVRSHLSTELGFSKEHRDLNIKRIGYVASEITKARGIAISAAIAPYAGARQYARDLISKHGGFVELYLSTPLETCEKRDRKGLYAKARKGLIKGFTGIDDPYEAPTNPEISLDTTSMAVYDAVETIVQHLQKESYL